MSSTLPVPCSGALVSTPLASSGLDALRQAADLPRLRRYRLSRLQEQMKARDLAACLLFDPGNVRYATGSGNLQVWHLHGTGRHAIVTAEGLPVLFEYSGCRHLSEGIETIGEIRDAVALSYFSTGPRREERVVRWAGEMLDVLRRCGGAKPRVAVDRIGLEEADALRAQGVVLVPGHDVVEYARLIKSDDELACMAASVAVCDAGMGRMREALRPGISENALWSHLHQVNIELGGEWIETRLLSSGSRTSPWFQECSDRRIEAGDLVAFDTDMIGPFGYCADLSRTFFCEPGRPSAIQRELYRAAWEQLQHNIGQARAGMSFRELSQRAWPIPDRYAAAYGTCIAHGVGIRDEYPRITHQRYWTQSGYDGELQAGMTLSFHSYVTRDGANEGVYLEQQVLITEHGSRVFSTFPFEDELLR